MWTKLAIYVFALTGSVISVPQGRVVNGTDSSITKYPFMISLREPQGSHSCGGTIIAPNWVLTAAHCVDIPYALNQTIQYGQTDVSIIGQNVVLIRRVIIHPDYRIDGFVANDIALIELAGKLIYNYKTIAPVQLPEAGFEIDQLSNNVMGVLAGWGLNATGGVRQKTLQAVDLKIYSDKECQELNHNETNNDQLCVGLDGKGSCSSDSGGPLIYKDSIQLGIVSYGMIPCGTSPSIFAKVSHYIDWIYRYIR